MITSTIDHFPGSLTMASVPLPDQSPPGLVPLLGIDDLVRIFNVSRRAVERMRSTGRLPRPDLKIGRLPRWRAETIREWIEDGGR